MVPFEYVYACLVSRNYMYDDWETLTIFHIYKNKKTFYETMTYSNFARTSSQCSEIDLFFNVGKGLSLQKFLCSGSFLCFYHVPHVPIGICLHRGVRGVWIIIGMACRLFTVTFISMIWFLLYNKLLFTNKAVLVVCSKYDDVDAFLTCTSRVQL